MITANGGTNPLEAGAFVVEHVKNVLAAPGQRRRAAAASRAGADDGRPRPDQADDPGDADDPERRPRVRRAARPARRPAQPRARHLRHRRQPVRLARRGDQDGRGRGRLRAQLLRRAPRTPPARCPGRSSASSPAPNPAEARAGLAACVAYAQDKAWFEAADDAGDLAFFAHPISRTGSYLSKEAGVAVGTPMAYLIAPPLEATYALDAGPQDGRRRDGGVVRAAVRDELLRRLPDRLTRAPSSPPATRSATPSSRSPPSRGRCECRGVRRRPALGPGGPSPRGGLPHRAARVRHRDPGRRSTGSAPRWPTPSTATPPGWARWPYEETGYGVRRAQADQDRVRLRRPCGSRSRTSRPSASCGATRPRRIVEIGWPVGVVVGLCPSTNPNSTAVYKVLISVKARNGCIIAPHPSAQALHVRGRAGDDRGRRAGRACRRASSPACRR